MSNFTLESFQYTRIVTVEYSWITCTATIPHSEVKQSTTTMAEASNNQPILSLLSNKATIVFDNNYQCAETIQIKQRIK